MDGQRDKWIDMNSQILSLLGVQKVVLNQFDLVVI